MSAVNDGGTAFPCPVEFDPNGQLVSHGSYGMTLRDWFAGQALAGLLVNAIPVHLDIDAKNAYAAADAMLAARKGGAQ